jgi:hypothetical protein
MRKMHVDTTMLPGFVLDGASVFKEDDTEAVFFHCTCHFFWLDGTSHFFATRIK